jgi:hypothetical protein
MHAPGTTRLGLRENLPQFALLVAINAFVGAMVGLERSTCRCRPHDFPHLQRRRRYRRLRAGQR